MKYSKWDIVFIITLAAILLLLEWTGNTDVLTFLPFMTVYGAYIIGRLVGELAHKEKSKNKE